MKTIFAMIEFIENIKINRYILAIGNAREYLSFVRQKNSND